MLTNDWINRLPLFAPEGADGGGADSSAGDAGTTDATADTGGDAGTKDGSEAPLAPVRDGKPGDAPEDTAAKDGAAKEGEDGSEADPTDAVPEDGKYVYDALPEGFEVDEKAAEQVSEIFKEAGLTQKQASVVSAKYAELIQEQAKANADVVGSTITGWVDEAKADSEIGGSRWDASVSAANKALEKFGTAELDAAMAASGLNSHPEMIRVFARIGAAIADDKFTPGTAGATDNRPPEERQYGATTPSGKKG